jgi:hypothetical protein
MRIDRRSDQGFQLRCAAGHVFLRESLGLTVECPLCGETAETTAVMADYYAPAGDDTLDEPVAKGARSADRSAAAM